MESTTRACASAVNQLYDYMRLNHRKMGFCRHTKTLGLFIAVKNVLFVKNVQVTKPCMFPMESPVLLLKLPLFNNADRTLTASSIMFI